MEFGDGGGEGSRSGNEHEDNQAIAEKFQCQGEAVGPLPVTRDSPVKFGIPK